MNELVSDLGAELAFANGETVTGAHADYCREHGHAWWRVTRTDGMAYVRGLCPRCGAVTDPSGDHWERV